jgi:hypothetical protein
MQMVLHWKVKVSLDFTDDGGLLSDGKVEDQHNRDVSSTKDRLDRIIYHT